MVDITLVNYSNSVNFARGKVFIFFFRHFRSFSFCFAMDKGKKKRRNILKAKYCCRKSLLNCLCLVVSVGDSFTSDSHFARSDVTQHVPRTLSFLDSQSLTLPLFILSIGLNGTCSTLSSKDDDETNYILSIQPDIFRLFLRCQ